MCLCAARPGKTRGKATTKPLSSVFRLPSSERGFSLIEMMISITIGLVIVAALVSVLISNSQSAKTNDRTAELQSNGRYALDHLKRELKHAGYRGYTALAPQSGPWIAPAITNECGTPLNFVKNIRQAVWGANDNNPFSANCLSSVNAKYDNVINSDVLVIRHVSSTPTLTASAVPNAPYLRSSYEKADVMQGSALPGLVLPVNTDGTENFALQVYVYYIGSDDNDATVPALRRVALADNDMKDQMVVSGIEQIQFEYGITNTVALTNQYFTANNIAGDHSANGTTNWDGVNSVRIWLLARNAKAEAGYTNTDVYSMGGSIYDPDDDSFRRQIFTTVVQLRNFRD